MSMKLTVAAPTIEDRKFTKPLLCGPGPCDYWPSVAEALTRPVITPFCDETYHVLDDIRAGIQYLFQTRSKMVFAMSGSGHAGMEAIISNLVGPKETILIANRGIWDDRAAMMATRYGINTEVMRVPAGSTFSMESLQENLEKTRPAALFITHGDGSTGTVQQLEGLGKLCHSYGTLLLVDTVVSIGGEPFFMDEWEVDGVYASTQKALSGPAGIIIIISCRKKIQNRIFEPPFYFDAKLLADQWNCFGNTRKHNILVFPGLGPTLGKSLRIGIMGVNSTMSVADAIADAMADTLKALNKQS